MEQMLELMKHVQEMTARMEINQADRRADQDGRQPQEDDGREEKYAETKAIRA
jgi:hypothetical protein